MYQQIRHFQTATHPLVGRVKLPYTTYHAALPNPYTGALCQPRAKIKRYTHTLQPLPSSGSLLPLLLVKGSNISPL